MASLTRTAILSRKTIRYGIYAIILIIIARITFNIGVTIFRSLFPPRPPKPTVQFGKLPPLPFPEKEPLNNLNFVLETPEGTLPTLPDQIEVYYMPPIASNIQALEVAKEKVRTMHFDPDGKPIVESIPNVYLFRKPKAPSTLTMNIITGVFSISYDINSNPSAIEGTPPPSNEAEIYVRSFLAGANLLTEDLKDGPATHELLAVEEASFVPAVSLSEANLVKINLFRKNLGKDKNVPSVTPSMPEANVWFLLSGYMGRETIAAEYHYFPLDKSKSSTYPLKTADTAWEELKSGQVFIANLGQNPGKEITIRRVYLAYYDAGLYTEFYQPVVVFEGDNNFYAFVTAITSEFYNQEE